VWFTDGGALNIAIGTNQVGKVNLSILPAKPLAKTASQFTSRVRTVKLDKRSFVPLHRAHR